MPVAPSRWILGCALHARVIAALQRAMGYTFTRQGLKLLSNHGSLILVQSLLLARSLTNIWAPSWPQFWQTWAKSSQPTSRGLGQLFAHRGPPAAGGAALAFAAVEAAAPAGGLRVGDGGVVGVAGGWGGWEPRIHSTGGKHLANAPA